ncbi:MAG: hypothetical protein IKK82_05195, partial [Kiritimatiellae bacterium]|nr:hypothetical protein [Kiritimatiellia bacterium]
MSRVFVASLLVAFSCSGAVEEPWFGAPIPASGEKPGIDCGMTAAKVFDAPIPGLERVGSVAVPKAPDVPDSSNVSIGFECLDRGLFNP